MAEEKSGPLVELDPSRPVWDSFFTVFPLVVVGTLEPDGTPDLAPKHMAMPMSWGNWFGFVCSPRHATERNARREGTFTVSFPRPDQLVLTSLAAAPRCEDGRKHGLDVLPTVPARRVRGVLLEDAVLQLECEVDRVVEGLDENDLLIGRIVAARVHEDALRSPDWSDEEVLIRSPALAYLDPGRFAVIDHAESFPFHKGFSR